MSVGKCENFVLSAQEYSDGGEERKILVSCEMHINNAFSPFGHITIHMKPF